jgi:hypothetical protein
MIIVLSVQFLSQGIQQTDVAYLNEFAPVKSANYELCSIGTVGPFVDLKYPWSLHFFRTLILTSTSHAPTCGLMWLSFDAAGRPRVVQIYN